jgi:hypothetical protein
MQDQPAIFKVFHRNYWRPASNFNPTLNSSNLSDLLANPYQKIGDYVKAGFMPT